MKATILALFLIFACASAFTPDWKTCESSDDWKVYFVGIAAAPEAGKNALWTICPKSLAEHDAVTIHVTAGTFFDLTLSPKDVRWTQYECLVFQFMIPNLSGETVFNFDLKSDSRATDGCLNVTLDLKSKSFLNQAF